MVEQSRTERERDRERERQKEENEDVEEEDEEERQRRWERPRVYNSPSFSSSLSPSSSATLPPPSRATLAPISPGIGDFFEGSPKRARNPREAARSRQAAKREQTDHSRAEPTPTARGRYTLLRFALLIRSVREDTVSDRATVMRHARARAMERKSNLASLNSK